MVTTHFRYYYIHTSYYFNRLFLWTIFLSMHCCPWDQFCKPEKNFSPDNKICLVKYALIWTINRREQSHYVVHFLLIGLWSIGMFYNSCKKSCCFHLFWFSTTEFKKKIRINFSLEFYPPCGDLTLLGFSDFSKLEVSKTYS